MTITCVVADDHPPVLQFVTRFLIGNGIAVAASTADGHDALRKIESLGPDVAVLDARMPGLGGVDVARRLAAVGSTTRVVLYTGYGEQALVNDALDAGVSGILDKEAPVEDLIRAIRIVSGGGTYVDSSLLGSVQMRGRERELTAREREVLRLLADGLSNEAVGAALSISAQTVRTHVQKAMDKLEAATRVQAVAIALRESLIS